MANFGRFGMGGMNMQQMMKQAQKLQESIKKAQEELENAEVEGTAGGGMVTVKINGKKKLLAIQIKPEAVDPDDVEMLEDLIMAAFNEAFDKADELYAQKMGMFGGLI
ncbi:MAG TPA: YbaB/EbfC family nucleoid-associated protein [Clostridia bacterium]